MNQVERNYINKMRLIIFLIVFNSSSHWSFQRTEKFERFDARNNFEQITKTGIRQKVYFHFWSKQVSY